MAPEKFSIPMRLMHWLMAICILGMIGSGWYMAGLDSDAADKYDLYPWHKSFGVLLLLLIVLRIIIRWFSKIPEPPASLPNHEKLLAKLAHYGLYLLMILVPLSGFIMSDIGGNDVFMFGIAIPDLLETNKDISGFFHTVHINIPYVLLALIALHVLGALKHRFFDKPEHDVLKKIL